MTSTSFFILFIPLLAILLLFVNLLLAPHNPYQEKDSAFECGFHSFLGQNRTQFSISFFIFGLLFLLFDLEILLVYPYSVSAYTTDIYGLAIMMIFFILLTLGFIFELGKNALSIESKQVYSFFEWWVLHNIPKSHSFSSLPSISSVNKLGIVWFICIACYYRIFAFIARDSLGLESLLTILLLLPVGLFMHYISCFIFNRKFTPRFFILIYLIVGILMYIYNLIIITDYSPAILWASVEIIVYLELLPNFLKPLVGLGSTALYMNVDGPLTSTGYGSTGLHMNASGTGSGSATGSGSGTGSTSGTGSGLATETASGTVYTSTLPEVNPMIDLARGPLTYEMQTELADLIEVKKMFLLEERETNNITSKSVNLSDLNYNFKHILNRVDNHNCTHITHEEVLMYKVYNRYPHLFNAKQGKTIASVIIEEIRNRNP